VAELAFPWVTTMLVTGAIALGVSWHPCAHRWPRQVALVVAGVLFLLAVGPLVELGTRKSGWLSDPWLGALGTAPWLGVDALSAMLLPFAALLSVLLAAVAPRATLGASQVRRSLLAGLVVLAMLSCRDAVVLAALWTLSIAVTLGDLRAPEHRRVFAVASRYLGLSVLLFWTGVLVPADSEGLDALGVGLMFAALMVRKGIVPLHGWMPEMFDRGRLGGALAFSTPQVAAYVTAVLVLPRASAAMLTTIGVLSLLTAVYAAAMSLVQRDPRRAFGWLFMSQSALVMAGLDSSSLEGLTGALCLWISSGLALAGLGATLWVLEARRGRLPLDRLHGGHDGMPLLASSFLILGLASVGFPGTLGFVGGELLVDGAVEQFPHIGFAVVVAGALNGMCVLRMYFSLFCGAPHRASTHLLARERWAFAGLAVLLLVAGLFPRSIVESRTAAAHALMVRPTSE
jgi:NADH-quinone oxidoreductase subunit M